MVERGVCAGEHWIAFEVPITSRQIETGGDSRRRLLLIRLG